MRGLSPWFLALMIVALSTTFARADPLDRTALRDGDLVFHTSRSSQAAAIRAATQSPYSHVGMILERDGELHVIEAVEPVRITPLDDWIARGEGSRLLVLSDPRLRDDQRRALIEAASQYLGRRYDIFFLFDDDAIYCSELIHLAYRSIGLDVGALETLGDLHLDAPEVKDLVARRWSRHPHCVELGDDPQACLEQTRSQPLITPASIAADSRLAVIFSDFQRPPPP